ncbi:MAG: dihydropteroate synthase [Balneolaceae bacterium]
MKLHEQNSWTIHGTRLDLSAPVVMGVLNVTPDSFSDGGEWTTIDRAEARVHEMARQGARIIDIGGESTRPGSDPVSEQLEMERVMPVLERVVSLHPDLLFSIDTTKFRVAEEALERGVHFVNDVSGLRKEPALAGLAARYGAGYICMHSQGEPKTMQAEPHYKDVVKDLLDFFREKTEELTLAGVSPVILDPGFGFGKQLKHNLELIRELSAFASLGFPLLVGISRKSMIGQILDGRSVEGRLAGTVAVHYHALMQGASILRVHDVLEAVDSIRVFQAVTGPDV